LFGCEGAGELPLGGGVGDAHAAGLRGELTAICAVNSPDVPRGESLRIPAQPPLAFARGRNNVLRNYT
jgi:hypothetical protein